MIRRLVLLATAAIAPLAAAVPTAAHQQKITISTVSLNPRTDRLELVHQVPVHDAEHALRVQGVPVPDIVGNPASREEFARYVVRRFMIAVDGVEAAPDYVGAEIIGGNLMVYLEALAPRPGAQITVNSQILTDVWARQENRVNIGGGTRPTTFVFTTGDAAQTTALPD